MCGVALATVNYRLPIVAGGGHLAVRSADGVRDARRGFERPKPREGERIHTGIVTTFKEGAAQVRAHHVLFLILGTAALHGPRPKVSIAWRTSTS